MAQLSAVPPSADHPSAARLAAARDALARAERLTGVTTSASRDVESAMTAAIDAAHALSSHHARAVGSGEPGGSGAAGVPLRAAAAVGAATAGGLPGAAASASWTSPPVRGAVALAERAAGRGEEELLPDEPDRDPWLGTTAASAGAIALTGSTALLLALAARRQGLHGWCAVVGGEDLGWYAAARAGLDLSRVLVVPAAGLDPASALAVCGALLDGVDLLVLSPGAVSLLRPRDRRTLLARARDRGALLLTPCPWEGSRELRAHLLEAQDDLPSSRRETRAAVAEVIQLDSRRPGPPAQEGGKGAAGREMPAGRLRRLTWRLEDPARPASFSRIVQSAAGVNAEEPAHSALPADAGAAKPADAGAVQPAVQPAVQSAAQPALTLVGRSG